MCSFSKTCFYFTAQFLPIYSQVFYNLNLKAFLQRDKLSTATYLNSWVLLFQTKETYLYMYIFKRNMSIKQNMKCRWNLNLCVYGWYSSTYVKSSKGFLVIRHDIWHDTTFLKKIHKDHNVEFVAPSINCGRFANVRIFFVFASFSFIVRNSIKVLNTQLVSVFLQSSKTWEEEVKGAVW